jgi:hypothetical protein
MLSAQVHRALSRWLLRVPSQNLGVMPLFAVTDLPFILAFTPRTWFSGVARLRAFRRNLKTRQWAGLAEVYPRIFMWSYAYLLIFWARYCRILPSLLADPDRCLLAENFIRYICEMDRHVDSFDSRALWRTAPNSLKHLPQVRRVADELWARLDQLDIPNCNKRSIVKLIADYRRDAFFGPARRWARSEAASYAFAELVADKERTAGNLWRTWSRLLGRIYDMPGDLAEDISGVFFNFGMAIQVIDDVSDAPADYRISAQNLFLAVAQQIPRDWERLQNFLESQPEPFLDWPWVRRNLPQAYAAALQLYRCYMDRLLAERREPALTRELHDLVEGLRGLGG